MPRYVVEHDFASGLDVQANDEVAETCLAAAGSHTSYGVTWRNAFLSPDNQKTLCIYDAPTPEAVRQFANKNNLPVSQIMEVLVVERGTQH
jgi:hypothetical protein